MSIYGKRTVVLRGAPIINEDGVAAATVRPGDLVDGVTSIAKHATAGGACPRTFALERDELGTGIDATYNVANTGAGSPNYAANDQVKVGAFAPGMRVTGWLASGQNIAANDRLESNGDGSLRKNAAGVILARALEAVDNSASANQVLIAVEVM